MQKALRSLERKGSEFDWDISGQLSELLEGMKVPTENRLQQVQQALSLGASIADVNQRTGIDIWFLNQISQINGMALEIKEAPELSPEMVRRGKRMGFSDLQIARLRNTSEEEIRAYRHKLEIRPVFKTVDTCAGEFEAYTPYHYSSYDLETEVKERSKPAVIILGSGPNRIGQGIEFDYSCVHASYALRAQDIETIMVNCNPETVSTDYDTSDRLYFEPLTLEDVLEIVSAESKAGPLLGVITQLGGQTPLGLASKLSEAGVTILGTSDKAIHRAEDRKAFGEILKAESISAPEFGTAINESEALEIATRIGYPVLVRPSFVLGGRGMEIVYEDDELKRFISKAVEINPEHPVLIDRFLDNAVEVDVDALYDGEELYLAGVMEHIEEAGIHSGDSACVIPPQQISSSQIEEIYNVTERLARAIGVRGLINVQYAIYNNKLFVLEANPRASRTVPFVSKATGVLLAKSAALISIGTSISELRKKGILPADKVGRSYGISVKEAVLPWNRFRRRDGRNVDSVLCAEMKSTGEVMGVSSNFGMAFAKSQTSAFGPLPKTGAVFISLSERDKESAWRSARELANLNFKIYATAGTHKFLAEKGISSDLVRKNSDQASNQMSANEIITKGLVQLVINTPLGRGSRQDGWLIRSAAVSRAVPCITTIPGFRAAVAGITALQNADFEIKSLQEWMRR